MLDFISKLLSKEVIDQLSAFILEQMGADLPGPEKLARAIDKACALVEVLDDQVILVPGWGPLLKLLLDNPATDSLEREQIVKPVVEMLYRALKIIP